MIYNGLFTADLHFNGAISERLVKEIEGCLYTRLERSLPGVEDQLPNVDFLVIGGDLLDSALGMNSRAAFDTIKVVKHIVGLCKRLKCAVRIIQGTRSHDNNQLRVIDEMIDKSEVDFKVIYTACEEELLPGFKVLYIPEEYMEDPKEFYSEFFKKKYDMIFMHGMVSDATVVLNCEDNKVIQHKKAPVFITEELIDICHGPILSGHIHQKSTYKEHFHYVGSMTPLGFGEEESKGFYEVNYDTDTHEYRLDFIENKLRPVYHTMELSIDGDGDVEEIVQNIFNSAMTKLKEVDFLRLKISIGENSKDSNALIFLIKESFKNLQEVKILFKSQQKNRDIEKNKEFINKLKGKYGFIFDKSKTKEEIISLFIKERYNKEVDEETISKIIYKTMK